MSIIVDLKCELSQVKVEKDSVCKNIRMLNIGTVSLEKTLTEGKSTGDNSGLGFSKRGNQHYNQLKLKEKQKIEFVSAEDLESYGFTNLPKGNWYFDSGSSMHMIGKKSYLSDLNSVNSRKDIFGDGARQSKSLGGKRYVLVFVDDFSRKDTRNFKTPKCHGEIAKLLVKECPELVTYANGVEESPLFVRWRGLFGDCTRILKVDLKLLYGGRDSATVLSAIIIRTLKNVSYTQNLIETPLRVYLALPVLYVNHFLPEVLGLPYWERKITCKLRPSQKDFIQKVLNKFPNILIEPDICGWVPLHYAAYLGSKELVEIILNHTPSMAYKKDNKGVPALHLAAKEGRSAVLKTFAKVCPDSCELLDPNDQTALHVAVANRQAYAVRKMLELGSFRNLVNQKDIDGNTPLHVAAIVGDYVIVMMLAANGRVDKKIMNKAGFTTNDIIRLNSKFSWYEKSFSIARLEFNGALRGMEQVLARKPRTNNLLLEKEESKLSNVTEQETNKSAIVLNNKASNQLQKSQIWSELSDANLVVATIIATVTFSAAFQVPGGYQSDGMAVLRKEKYFRLYLISDALSFGFAAASMFVTFFTGLFGANSGFSYPRRWVTFLTGISVWFMVFAFMLGTSAVMTEHSGFAGLARSVACVSFIWPVVFLGAVAVNWFTYFP
ncbi:LOW QUALITY PROTEIN: ankyrin repeat-containing protein NPR4-like [Benincasa hispida]|uniref:LOW QUALITY PROTEIN: ankyrin repeat-containing protein NPR4-like n=1 Tax=Benincasa hispida TaxID=102211 RepID=UPI0018FF7D8A|nr:LOW QUALITY PROTEIN: ankyrin repeat-containing protein NPR4-like [Benincasa hispida]